MIRVVAWMLRFIHNCRKEIRSCKNSELLFSDIDSAEKFLIHIVQKCYFPDIKCINSIDVFLDDDDNIRVKTRITERKDIPSFLAPYLLPANCTFTKLLTESVHKKNCHAGVQMLQCILRERFWICKSRRTIRSVVNKCTKYRRYKAEPMLCKPTPLPADRVENSTVFEVIGLILLAIHLELVASLSTDLFLLALRRFISSRGRPKAIYSDNGSNLGAAFHELSSLDWETIMRETNTERIVWKFNPPTASWWGGWWKRLVRVIKELLRRTLGKSVLSYEELLTILCDCESIIKSRPLAYVSENSEDLIPLTPSMFLKETSSCDVTDIDSVDSSHLRKRIRSRFRRDYLSQLIQRHKQNKDKREPRVGKIVLVGNDSKKRINWPLAVIVELVPERDGNV
ncbi:integrase catalytic domain-containing protein [Trichonephila clavipes]|nr:integrase catalytic domain-containing protein [Trichonephila clavipes]